MIFLPWKWQRLVFGVSIFLALAGARALAASEEKKDELPGENPLFSLDAGVQTQGVYDTNIFQTRFNEEDDFYLTVQPRLGVHLGYRALGADLVYQPRFIFFTSNFGENNLDDILQDARLASTIFSSEKFDLEVKDTLSMTKTLFSNPETPNNLSLQNIVALRGIFTHEFGPRTQLQLTGEGSRRDIQDPGEDYFRYGGVFSLTREFHPVVSALIRQSGYYTMYDRGSVGDDLSFTSEAGVQLNFWERLVGKVLGSYDYLILPGPNNEGQFGYRVELEGSLSPTTTASASFKQYLGRDQRGKFSNQRIYSALLSQQAGPRTLLTVESYLNELKIPSAGIGHDRLWGVKAGVSYEITEKFRAGVRYEMDHNFGPTQFNDFTAHRGILELTYDFGKLLTVY